MEDADAYSSYYFIGLYYEDHLYSALVSYKNIHETLHYEIGHTIDLSKREYQERSNNVLKKFSNIKIEKKNIL